MRENSEPVVLFVCEHGSAKSVVAAAHFNKLAREKGLNVRALSRGTDPDKEFPPHVLRGLRKESLTPGEAKPKLLSEEDIAGAVRLVAFCDLPNDTGAKLNAESWSDVPPVSENYAKARDEIAARVGKLLNEMQSISDFNN
jgi:protein-tyrosine-phosphatase